MTGQLRSRYHHLRRLGLPPLLALAEARLSLTKWPGELQFTRALIALAEQFKEAFSVRGQEMRQLLEKEKEADP